MAKFVNMEDNSAIIDFNNMSVKQFRFLVRKAIDINNYEDNVKENNQINELFDGRD